MEVKNYGYCFQDDPLRCLRQHRRDLFRGHQLYRCADCGAERPDSMPAADLAAINSILALGDTEGKLDELRRRYPNLDITSWSRENRVQMG